jgi:hypothetical protein
MQSYVSFQASWCVPLAERCFLSSVQHCQRLYRCVAALQVALTATC